MDSDERRSVRTFRASPKEFRVVETAAARLRIPVSSFVRRVAILAGRAVEAVGDDAIGKREGNELR